MIPRYINTSTMSTKKSKMSSFEKPNGISPTANFLGVFGHCTVKKKDRTAMTPCGLAQSFWICENREQSSVLTIFASALQTQKATPRLTLKILHSENVSQ